LIGGTRQPSGDPKEVLALSIVNIEAGPDKVRHDPAPAPASCASKGLHAAERDR
jgi:hypothetical protein